MTIAKKIALITGGKIHNEERETPLSSLNERVISRVTQRASIPKCVVPGRSPPNRQLPCGC